MTSDKRLVSQAKKEQKATKSWIYNDWIIITQKKIKKLEAKKMKEKEFDDLIESLIEWSGKDKTKTMRIVINPFDKTITIKLNEQGKI